jgi:Transglycosylase-like domain
VATTATVLTVLLSLTQPTPPPTVPSRLAQTPDPIPYVQPVPWPFPKPTPTVVPVTPAPAPSPSTEAPLTAPPSAGPSGTDWYAIAQCESGGNWADTDGLFEGGLQFLNSTWLAFGGGAYAPHAYQATPAEQIAVAERTLAGSASDPWPNCP